MTATKKYIATETTQTEIRDFVEAIKNTIVAGGGGSGVTPHITVFAPTGSTVTASKGPAVLTAEESNGVWQFNVPSLGDWVISCTKDGHTGNKTVSVDEVKEYKVRTSYGYRYGYRIKKGEGSPSARVEYLFDAVGMTPAHMDFTRGIFDFGDWGDKWFVTENKPCMLKSDGTVDYYLNPNNYAQKEDGTASDVANTAYDGNAMSLLPQVWVHRYEDSDWQYEIISDVQYDSNYKAYAHTRADGTIADWFAWSMFGGSKDGSGKMRSLSGLALSQSLTAQQEIDACKLNGTKWYTHTWSQRELIRTLLVLMGKSTDTQSVFGNGNCQGSNSASALLATGTLKDKGQFFGYNSANQQVKVFHIEGFWGDQWDRTAGVIGGKVKMTPEGQGYRVTDTNGYHDTGISVPGNGSYISEMSCDEYGMIPKVCSGSATTYFPDGCWGGTGYLIAGACASIASTFGGAFSFVVVDAPSHAAWDVGCGLSCEQPAAA